MREVKSYTCSSCKINKPISEFYKRSDRAIGIHYRCKECCDGGALRHDRTKTGLIKRIYYNQVNHCKIRGWSPPLYSKVDLINFMLSNSEFHLLHKDWVDSDYEKWLVPSIDRKDDYKSYSLDNIQITTFFENNSRAHYDRRNGINNKASKAVLQYDFCGNFIKEYFSTCNAFRETGIKQSSISKACLNKGGRAGRFLWKFKTDHSEIKPYNRIILRCNLDGSVIKEYPLIIDLEPEFYNKRRSIYNACAGLSQSSCGYIWKYREF